MVRSEQIVPKEPQRGRGLGAACSAGSEFEAWAKLQGTG